MFGIYLLCQYHGEFDRIGFCHFEIGYVVAQCFTMFWSMRAASSLCLENMVLICDTFTCVFACLEFTYCVSTMGNLIALGFAILKLDMWLFNVLVDACCVQLVFGKHGFDF